MNDKTKSILDDWNTRGLLTSNDSHLPSPVTDGGGGARSVTEGGRPSPVLPASGENAPEKQTENGLPPLSPTDLLRPDTTPESLAWTHNTDQVTLADATNAPGFCAQRAATEHLLDTQHELLNKAAAVTALQALTDIAADPATPPETRRKAATQLLRELAHGTNRPVNKGPVCHGSLAEPCSQLHSSNAKTAHPETATPNADPPHHINHVRSSTKHHKPAPTPTNPSHPNTNRPTPAPKAVSDAPLHHTNLDTAAKTGDTPSNERYAIPSGWQTTSHAGRPLTGQRRGSNPMKNSICAIALMGLSGTAMAGAIDGTAFDVKYGTAVWSQNVGTGFGNNTDADPLFGDGSEINAVYGSISGGVLRLGIAGNLQTNFNKINIALDFKSGGQNQLSGLGNLGNLNGLTFDQGFESDAILSFTHGNNYDQFIDGAVAGDAGGFLGGGASTGTTTVMLGAANVVFGMNNSNTGGVGAFGNPNDSDPALVNTGLEIQIDLAALGYTGGAVNIAGWINGAGNDFMSNQVIGGLPDGTNNLGGDGAGNFTGNVGGIDFNNFAGDQFVTIVPAPGTIALLGLGGIAAIRRRR